MKSLFAIAAATFMIFGILAGSVSACPYTDKVTASTKTSQTVVDEG